MISGTWQPLENIEVFCADQTRIKTRSCVGLRQPRNIAAKIIGLNKPNESAELNLFTKRITESTGCTFPFVNKQVAVYHES